MGRRQAAAVLLSALGLMLSGCGDDTVATGERTTDSYAGPLRVSRGEAEHPGAGAAGNVVECAAWGDGGSTDGQEYGEGATAASAGEALEVASSEGAFGGVQRGLLVARQEPDRVLYVLAVDGAVKQAVIVRNGPATEGAGGPGWYVESWAHCDYSELPRSFTDGLGLQIWTDSDGRPLPTTTIESWEGPEHCDWQSMTFLHLGRAVYVRNPQPDLADFFATPTSNTPAFPQTRSTPGTSGTGTGCGCRRTGSGPSSGASRAWRPGPARSIPWAAPEGLGGRDAVALGLQQRPQQSDVPGGGDAGHLVVREHPRDRRSG